MVMRQPSSKPGLLTLTIKDKSALYLAYMPFVKKRRPVHSDQQQLPARR